MKGTLENSKNTSPIKAYKAYSSMNKNAISDS
jgi:hypothetical protein